MTRHSVAALPLAIAASLVMLAFLCLVEPRVTVGSTTFQLVQAGLIFGVVYAFQRAHRRQVSAIDARLEEMRRMVRLIRAANENETP
jgi:hypothetical protein